MTPSQRIDHLISELTDWRGRTFAALRKTILAVNSEITEEWKWRGTPVWSHDEIIAVANPHEGKVKITFFRGAKLADPDTLFNAGLEGGTWRAVDFFEGDKINERGLKALVRAAIDFNQTKSKKTAPAGARAKPRKTGKPSATSRKVRKPS